LFEVWLSAATTMTYVESSPLKDENEDGEDSFTDAQRAFDLGAEATSLSLSELTQESSMR
jgi:hypothetical protein